MGKAQALRRKAATTSVSSRKAATAAAALGKPSDDAEKSRGRQLIGLSSGQRKRALKKENFRHKAAFAAAMVGQDKPEPTRPANRNPYFGFEPAQGKRVGPISAAAHAAAAMEVFSQDLQAARLQSQRPNARAGDGKAGPVVAPSTMQLPRRVRDGIEVEEVAQLKAVVGHKNFQANPFMALQYHLHSTLPPPEVPQRVHHNNMQKKKKKKETQQQSAGAGGGNQKKQSGGGGGGAQSKGPRSASRGRGQRR